MESQLTHAQVIAKCIDQPLHRKQQHAAIVDAIDEIQPLMKVRRWNKTNLWIGAIAPYLLQITNAVGAEPFAERRQRQRTQAAECLDTHMQECLNLFRR